MHWIDITLIVGYLAATIVIGLLLRRRATGDIDSYFLGNRRMSWWLLGASGMASNVDMSGTMLIASLIFVFGMQGFYIELRGGVVLIMAFYLALMGKWTRRSECMTIAEWMEFRFGGGWQGRLPRLLSALGNIVFFVWCIAYFAVGSAKFLEVFLPWDDLVAHAGFLNVLTPWSRLVLSGGLILVVVFYTALAGLHGVVWLDVLQGGLILVMAVYLSVKAFVTVTPEMIQQAAGDDWTSLVPRWQIDCPAGYEGYHLLGLSISFYLLKTAIDGLSGAGGYIAQRYFASRDERECRRVSLCWIVLMAFRWPLVMGVAMLGLTVRDKFTDPELVLPVVLQELVPVGLRGVMIVALLAAAMSTYSSVMNAGASYFVKDIYQAFLRPRARQSELVAASVASTIVFVLIGLGLAFGLPRVNDVWSFLNMGLGVGLLMPNFLRWYWWRFNGFGYAAGVAVGMAAALVQQVAFRDAPEYIGFSVIASLVLVTMIIVSLLTPAVPPATIRNFFLRTRPFGFWKAVRRELPADDVRRMRRENRRELAALLLAVPGQIVLFLLPMTVVMHRWRDAALLALALLVCSIGLRRIWAREDRNADAGPAARPAHA